MKKILSFNSHVTYGHVGHSASIPALQEIGHEIWPIHTVQLSNHKGYDHFGGGDMDTAHLGSLIDGLNKLNVPQQVDAIFAGYLGTQGAARQVQKLMISHPDKLTCIDPVMGDHDRLYVPEQLALTIKEALIPHADIITPNTFELSYLADAPADTVDEAVKAAHIMLGKGPNLVLVTSLYDADSQTISMLCATQEATHLVTTPFLPLDPQPNGAGDLVAALFLASFLTHRDAAKSLSVAASGVLAVLDCVSAGQREMPLIEARQFLTRPPRYYRASVI